MTTTLQITKVTRFAGTLFISLADGSKIESLSSDSLKKRVVEDDTSSIEGELELAELAEQFLASRERS